MKNLIVLVSGGRSSAMMARHIQTNEKYSNYNKVYVFCNTGLERHETINFLKDMIHYWNLPLICVEGIYSLEPGIGVKHRVVSIDSLDMEGKVFNEAIMQQNKYKNVGLNSVIAIPAFTVFISCSAGNCVVFKLGAADGTQTHDNLLDREVH